jgi:hypothetical protein
VKLGRGDEARARRKPHPAQPTSAFALAEAQSTEKKYLEQLR